MAQCDEFVSAGKKTWLAIPSFKDIAAYVEVTKPVMVFLLIFTGVVGFAIASHGVFLSRTFMLTVFTLAFGCAGANALTCYIDRDIDAVMVRTRNRPIPSSRLSPESVLLFGIVLSVTALILSLFLNLLTFSIFLIGIVNNVVVYSLWAKRRTSLNIIIGSLAGGLPVLAGYAAFAGSVDPGSLFLAVLIIVWIPVHIWSIALKYREDYMRANVPMLPVVMSAGKATKLIGLMVVVLVAFSLVPFFSGWFGMIYLYTAAASGGILLCLSFRLVIQPAGKGAGMIAKVSSIYLGLLFLSLLIDQLT
jgi:protoheme IX farnesyltransferase